VSAGQTMKGGKGKKVTKKLRPGTPGPKGKNPKEVGKFQSRAAKGTKEGAQGRTLGKTCRIFRSKQGKKKKKDGWVLMSAHRPMQTIT